MLGGIATLHYLKVLDLQALRYFKNIGYDKQKMKELAYLLVTYAIELRAEELYPIYDSILRAKDSIVKVKSILLEEKQHLREMQEGIKRLLQGWDHAETICQIESRLCKRWLLDISHNLKG